MWVGLTLAALAGEAVAAPVLRAAVVHVTVNTPTSCVVTMTLTVDGATRIDHRLELFDGARVELTGIRGAHQVGGLRAIGRTQSLVLESDQPSYEFAYGIVQPDDRAYRCPIWLPAVPADGRSRAVHFQIDLPPATSPGNTMPDFTWTGTHGSTTLAHLPAIVRVRYGAPGEAREWDLGRTIDVLTVAVFASATVVWVWRVWR